MSVSLLFLLLLQARGTAQATLGKASASIAHPMEGVDVAAAEPPEEQLVLEDEARSAESETMIVDSMTGGPGCGCNCSCFWNAGGICMCTHMHVYVYLSADIDACVHPYICMDLHIHTRTPAYV
jgi:hypothetical protein